MAQINGLELGLPIMWALLVTGVKAIYFKHFVKWPESWAK